MSATTYFIHVTGENNTIGEVDGGENAIHALSYTGDTLQARLFACEAVSLIQSFPDKGFVSEDLVKELEELPSDEVVGVSIDF
jgi:hypothetical protein